MAKKILVVDDDPVSRLVLSTILKREPRWEVVTCNDGQEALDVLCDGLRPDLCLIDLQMPKMGGHELVQRVRRDPQLQALEIVIVSGSRDKEAVVIEVQDTGTGIPEKVRDHIFEPFFTTKGVGKGTGQGLTITHTIVVKKHNGRIDFATEVGKGTTFKLSLPILLLPAETAE